MSLRACLFSVLCLVVYRLCCFLYLPRARYVVMCVCLWCVLVLLICCFAIVLVRGFSVLCFALVCYCVYVIDAPFVLFVYLSLLCFRVVVIVSVYLFAG